KPWLASTVTLRNFIWVAFGLTIFNLLFVKSYVPETLLKSNTSSDDWRNTPSISEKLSTFIRDAKTPLTDTLAVLKNRPNYQLLAALACVAASRFSIGDTLFPALLIGMDLIIYYYFVLFISVAWLLVSPRAVTPDLAYRVGVSTVMFDLGISRICTCLVAICCVAAGLATQAWVFYAGKLRFGISPHTFALLAGIIYLATPTILSLLSRTVPSTLHGVFFSSVMSIAVLAAFVGIVLVMVALPLITIYPIAALVAQAALLGLATALLFGVDGRWIEEAEGERSRDGEPDDGSVPESA
ncbi:hypothetical protein BDK51DRAFT_29435, partial [Blyttiomyces helicus]